MSTVRIDVYEGNGEVFGGHIRSILWWVGPASGTPGCEVTHPKGVSVISLLLQSELEPYETLS
jgi:hypothetical protein